ncbi:MAG: hypothetical protein FJX40_15215, partial [Alphaproteobacteria bacterium]|nr:hypothetical protein [Alphaproteobacteria bacterium]MBM3641661.1 hypothetical protein [Alphaproteobacteria bacterium]
QIRRVTFGFFLNGGHLGAIRSGPHPELESRPSLRRNHSQTVTQLFLVLGEVTKAGQYPTVENMTVRSAIAAAGGFTPGAYEGGADLTRLIDRHPVTACVTLDFPVRPGDTITALQGAL